LGSNAWNIQTGCALVSPAHFTASEYFYFYLFWKALAEKVLEYRLDMQSGSPYFPTEIAEAINQLWKDPIIPKIMEHSSDFHLMDSAP
jgi:hypothetical protein